MQHLNLEQRKAVTATDGPALVLAGAGAGKTRVIVERIVWLIEERGVDPRNILALTFTNRAAREMASRIASRLGTERIASWVGTFHSFGLFVLRRDIERLGRKKQFTIFDDGDQLSLMKRLVKALDDSWAQVNPRAALNWISAFKAELDEPDASVAPGDNEEKTLRELWKRYHAALAKAQAVDFDDLLVLPAKLLEGHEDVRERYRRRYRYVLIDEYQDTNRAQYSIARALAGEEGNLFVVGDEDQAIYSWRGADIRNILEFEKDFPKAQVFRLEQNYRSTAPILNAANAVVANNINRLGKELWTERQGGRKVAYYQAPDADDEARFVVETITKSDWAPRDVAVLFRTNGQARVVEEALRRRGLAYVVIGGVKFYARKEVKDILAYLRLLVNSADDESLRRIINVPPRGIGQVTLERLAAVAAARNESLLEAMRTAYTDEGLQAKASQEAEKLAQLIDELALAAKDKRVAEIVEMLIDKTGYREHVEKTDEKDYVARLEIVDEFISSCAEFDEKDGRGLEDFLQDLALMTDMDALEPGAPAVTLMTCHSAKGLEFDHVFLMGLEEGLLPHMSSMRDEEDIEEERRLCYVAMTRAKETLILTSAEGRLMYGEHKMREPSRFLGEIPPGQLEFLRAQPQDRKPRASGPAMTVDTKRLTTGTLVRHARFGRGRVMYTSGSGAYMNVRIRFDTGMSRQFRVSATPLEILEGKK